MSLDETFDFEAVGGTVLFGAQEDGGPVINFGVAGQPGLEGPTVMCAAPDFGAVAPHLYGRWDGQTTVCQPELARKVLGKTLPAQYQSRGTCGGRNGSRGLENLQVSLMATGERGTFYEVSHAWPYFLARREYNMLRGGDGVPDGSIPPVLKKYGALSRAESGDTIPSGPGNDNVATAWGGGRLSGQQLEEFFRLASDNLIVDYVRLRSAQEVADALTAGGTIFVSDNKGYSMTRDRYGVCGRRGVWYHYHGINGVAKLPDGRVVFSYEQSWGPTVPGGTLLLDGMFPGHCFGISEQDMEATCRQNSVHAAFAFPLWDPKPKLIDWKKYF